MTIKCPCGDPACTSSVLANVATDGEAREFVSVVRHNERMERLAMLASWAQIDLAVARDWKTIQAVTGIDTSADVRRNVGYARRWHHEKIKLLRRSKLQ